MKFFAEFARLTFWLLFIPEKKFLRIWPLMLPNTSAAAVSFFGY
jgi:hypothetical protein